MNKQVDLIRIRELFGHLNDAQRQLRQLGSQPEDVFLADFRNTASAKYLFVMVAEAAIDVCNHIVSRQEGRAPETYADCFDVLTDIGVIQPDLAKRLQMMARFRNLLVHMYGMVDDGRVYHTIHHGLDDLDAFQQQVLAWIKAGDKN